MSFSIIMPVYNGKDTVEIAVASVLNQTFNDFELLIIDDGSNDDTAAILTTFNDSRVSIYHRVNSGVSATRNFGISKARNNWIAFLDSDDWWHPEYLKVIFDIIEKNHNFKIISTRYNELQDSSEWNPYNFNVEATGKFEVLDDIAKEWLVAPPFFTSSIVIERDFLCDFSQQFYDNISCGEDIEFWFRLSETEPVCAINDKLVVYRTMRDNSLSSQVVWTSIPFFLNEILDRSKFVDDDKRKSYIKFVNHCLITNAKKLSILGRRLYALKFLFMARTSFTSLRWQYTLFETVFLPRKKIAKRLYFKKA